METSESGTFGALAFPQALTYVGYGAGAATFAVATGIFLYIVASFLLMRAHTAPRSLGSSLRAALRETLVVLITQPLIPLYYFRGRSMGGTGPGDPIVFVHGYSQNRSNFIFLARILRAAQVGPLFGFNYPWGFRVEASAVRLARFVESVVRETGRPHVSLVAHSLGGLVCLEYMHSKEGAARVRKCVTLGSPHAGVTWRVPVLSQSGGQMRLNSRYLGRVKGREIVVPTLSIYSTHDNIVHPPTTSTLTGRGGRDHVVTEIGHLSILFDRGVSEEVVRFLSEHGNSSPGNLL